MGNTAWILNMSMVSIFFGIYGMFIFECYALRPIFFSLYFWWTILSLVIFATFTLICIDWKYWKTAYYLIFVPIYALYFLFISGTYKINNVIQWLTIDKNMDKMEITKNYQIFHISLGIMMNMFLIFLYLVIQIPSITQCEFMGPSKQIVSHLVLQCQSNKVQIQNGDAIYYQGKQKIIGLIWISLGSLSFIISIVSFVSCVLWTMNDTVCNDQVCINYAKYLNQSNGNHAKHISTIVTKHIAFINSNTILMISCAIWCILIWITIQSIKYQSYDENRSKNIRYIAVSVG